MKALEGVTLLAVVAAGYFSASALVVPAAALALMLDSVFGKAYRLRQNPPVPLTTKMTTYLVMGALGWLLAAWLAYVAGGFLRGLLT